MQNSSLQSLIDENNNNNNNSQTNYQEYNNKFFDYMKKKQENSNKQKNEQILKGMSLYQNNNKKENESNNWDFSKSETPSSKLQSITQKYNKKSLSQKIDSQPNFELDITNKDGNQIDTNYKIQKKMVQPSITNFFSIPKNQTKNENQQQQKQGDLYKQLIQQNKKANPIQNSTHNFKANIVNPLIPQQQNKVIKKQQEKQIQKQEQQKLTYQQIKDQRQKKQLEEFKQNRIKQKQMEQQQLIQKQKEQERIRKQKLINQKKKQEFLLLKNKEDQIDLNFGKIQKKQQFSYNEDKVINFSENNNKENTENEENNIESGLKQQIQNYHENFNIEDKFSYSSLIQLMFTKDYNDEASFNIENKQIPNNFTSALEYNTIFQYLFINECIAKLFQVIQSYKKSTNYTLGQPAHLNLKSEYPNPEGFSVFNIGIGHTQLQSIDSNDNFVLKKKSEQQKNGLKSDSVFEQESNEFDLEYQKNYIMLASSEKEIDFSKLSNTNFGKNKFLFMGLLVPPANSNKAGSLYSHIQLKTCVDGLKFKHNCSQNTVNCYLYPLEKISTYIREYIAIKNIHFQQNIMRFLVEPSLLEAEKHQNIIKYPQILQKFIGIIENQYNTTQCQTIREICLMSEGISLLQGPPGTGKTHTLLGLVSGLYYYQQNAPENKNNPQKIMICAPSNTAIDEVIERIQSQGLISCDGKKISANIVRIGILSNNASQNVKSTCLEHQAQQVLNEMLGNQTQTATELRIKIEKINEKINKLQKMKCQNLQQEQKNLQQIDRLKEQRKQYYEGMKKVKFVKAGNKTKYKDIMNNILIKSDIICCTLNSSASDKLDLIRNEIECLIIDEAAQSTEPNSLIPMMYGPKKIVLIGDPKQLPATTFSKDFEITKYNRSLLERIIANKVHPYFLDIQYRMNSKIREFPSKMFYKNKLKDADYLSTRQIPYYMQKVMGKSVIFIDILHSRQKSIDKSYINEQESMMTIKILNYFLQKINKNINNESIGVISPYKQQARYIQKQFQGQIDANQQYKLKDVVMVNTVDSFQGQEKDLIIFSSVRAINDAQGQQKNRDNLIGFLSDERRLNVAITRAKYGLIIIGNSDTLSSDEKWSQLINHCVSQDGYIKVNNNEQLNNIWQQFIQNQVPQQQKKYIPQQWGKKVKQKTKTLKLNDFTGEQGQGDDEEEEGQIQSEEDSVQEIQFQQQYVEPENKLQPDSLSLNCKFWDQVEEKEEKQVIDLVNNNNKNNFNNCQNQGNYDGGLEDLLDENSGPKQKLPVLKIQDAIEKKKQEKQIDEMELQDLL